jgi:hypothetical protein
VTQRPENMRSGFTHAAKRALAAARATTGNDRRGKAGRMGASEGGTRVAERPTPPPPTRASA